MLEEGESPAKLYKISAFGWDSVVVVVRGEGVAVIVGRSVGTRVGGGVSIQAIKDVANIGGRFGGGADGSQCLTNSRTHPNGLQRP